MATTGLALLLAAFLYNFKKPQAFVIFIVSLVYILNLWVYQSALDQFLNEYLGYYVSQSLFEVLVVLLLAQVPSKCGVVIMSLCLVAVLVNIVGFSLEFFLMPKDEVINYFIWVLFLLQIAVLFSKRVTNALFRAITKSAMVRVFCFNYLRIDNKGAK